MKERVNRIFSKMEDGCDAVVLMNGQEPMLDASFYYACGIDSGLFEECVAILLPDGSVTLITSQLEESAAKNSSAEIITYSTQKERDDAVKNVLKDSNKIGINSRGITYSSIQYLIKIIDHAEFIDAGSALVKARMVKDSNEIEKIRSACKIASSVADSIPEVLSYGKTEYEIAAEIGYRMQKMGASSTSFDTIAAFGKSAAEPHHLPEDYRLQKGDMGLFDFGCRVSRYCSDITRTFAPIEPSDLFKKVYETVLEAQRLAIENIRAGVCSADIDKVARDCIDSVAEFKGKMIHSLGHGLGLDVHDGGSFSPRSQIILEENMVMTVEPGIYLSGWGGVRIEDDILVTKDGCELLTHAKKDFDDVKIS